MNARQKKLLKILINEEDYISVDQLMDQLAVSKRTVHNDLCKVEDFLSDYHIELKRKSKYIAPSNDENPIEFIVNWIKELKNK